MDLAARGKHGLLYSIQESANSMRILTSAFTNFRYHRASLAQSLYGNPRLHSVIQRCKSSKLILPDEIFTKERRLQSDPVDTTARSRSSMSFWPFLVIVLSLSLMMLLYLTLLLASSIILFI